MCARKAVHARSTFGGPQTSKNSGRRSRPAAGGTAAALVLSLVALLAAYPEQHGAQSAAGELDASFGGGDGRVNDNFGQPYLNQANAVVVQPDGKIVIAARASFGQERGFDFALARYLPDGSLDPTFGAGGKVVTDINLGGDVPYALVLQPDGKLVAAGTALGDAAGVTTPEYALVRYNPDGSLDPTFGGGDGIVVTDLFGNGDTAYALALQPDGKLVAAGTSGQNGAGANFSAARYNPDGSLDTTFGEPDPAAGARSGRVMTDFVAWNDIGRGVALQADGRVVVAGHTQTPSTNNYDFALVRYEADGDLDPTFGGDGRVTTRFFEDDYVDDERAYAVRVQPDGRIVAAGFARDNNETQFATQWDDFALARYNPDGSLDPTFGAGGLVWTNISVQPGGADRFYPATKDRAHALLLQPDGKLVAGGFASCCSDDGTEDFALTRYNPDGSLDPSFGGDGIVRTDFLGRFDTDDEIYGMALQQDGRVVAVGRTETDPYLGTYDYAVARYAGAPGQVPAPTPAPTPIPTPTPTPTPAPPPPARVNHALAANGATATASTTLSLNRTPSAVINGDRRGLHWDSDPATGSGWTDATQGAFPDWLEIAFAGPRAVQEVSVFTVQDAYADPQEPTPQMTFSKYGVTGFRVEYWTGSAWAAVPGGAVTSNNKVWSKLTFAPVLTTKIKVVVNSGLLGHSRLTEVEAWGAPPNVALAANGATATASTTLNAGRHPSAAINGDRRGLHWGSDPATGSGWTDATKDSFPDRLEIAFAGAKTITEVSVFGLQDNYASPAEPTEAMTSTAYALQDFDVEYWTGSAWAVVPGGQVIGNDRVWRRVRFAPLVTTKVRVVVKKAQANYSRVVEVEVY